MAVPENGLYYLEIVTPEVETVRDLFANTYGWSFQPAAPELGNAFVARLPGGSLCGIRAPMHEQEKPIIRTYIRVADVVRAAKQAESLGGRVILPPMEIPGRGKIVIFEHGGIQQGVWEVREEEGGETTTG